MTASPPPYPRPAFDVVMLKPEPARGKGKRPLPKGGASAFPLARSSPTGLGRTPIKAPMSGAGNSERKLKMTDKQPPFNLPKSLSADHYGGHWIFCYASDGVQRGDYDFRLEFTEGVPEPEQVAIVSLLEVAPKLLSYAECEAAVACGKADPRYDPRPVLNSHGWNEQTESAGLFLARIRRKAVEDATGSYLGRAA